MNRKSLHDRKLEVLKMIKKKKKLLICNTNRRFTVEKQKAWNEILRTAQALQLAGPHRNWMFMRDNVFGVWKNRTIAKRSQPEKKYDDVDKAILDLLDYDVRDFHDNYAKKEVNIEMLQVDDPLLQIAENNHTMEEKRKFKTSSPPKSKTNLSPKLKRRSSPPFESDLKKSKRLEKLMKKRTSDEESELFSELLKIEIYHKRLECLKLERELNLCPSEFTNKVL